MTPTVLLTTLATAGAVVAAAGERLRVEAPPGVLTPQLRAAITEHKGELLRLILLAGQYRATLRRGFALVASGPAPAPAECAEFLAEQARLEAALGPALAIQIGRDEAGAWHRDTGRCPWCGERGPVHTGEASAGPEGPAL